MANSPIGGYQPKASRLIVTLHTDAGISGYGEGSGGGANILRKGFADLVIGEELYRRFPDATEGELTSLRATLVSSTALAEIGRRLGLPDRARLGRGEEETGGRSRMGLAASLYESFIGAVYYEAGFDRAKELVLETMGGVLDDIAHTSMKSAKQLLQEWAQGEKLPLPAYRMLEISGPEHHRGFEVEVEVDGHIARGTGASKREAQEAAAAKLLELVTK